MIKFSVAAMLALSLVMGSARAGSSYATKPISNAEANTFVMSAEQLKAFFLLSISRWDDGTKVVVIIMPPESIVQRRFFYDYFGLTPSRYFEIVASKVYSGKATSLVIVPTESDMIRQVGKTIGSIGFVGSTIYIGEKDGVKSIQIK